jgi:hypothetical protein
VILALTGIYFAFRTGVISIFPTASADVAPCGRPVLSAPRTFVFLIFLAGSAIESAGSYQCSAIDNRFH